MSVASHVLGKDVRRHVLWLVAWLAVCAGPLAALGLPDDALMTRVAINTAAPAVRLALFLMLVQMVVHEDPLVDSTAFWLTRPIGGRALLGGKLLFVAVLLVLPAVAADVALIGVTGLASRQVWLAIPEIALEWTLWASAMFALASLTSTFRGVLGVALRVAILWVVVGLAWPFLVHAERFRTGTSPSLSVALLLPWDVDSSGEMASFVASRTIAVSVLELVACVGTAAVLFFTRRIRLAWATIGLAIVAVVALSTEWRWNFFATTASAMPTAAGGAVGRDAALSIDLIGRTSSWAQQAAGSDSNQRVLYGRIAVTGLEPPLAAGVQRLSGSLTFADGTGFAAGGAGEGVMGIWSPTAVEALLDGARLVNLDQEHAFARPIVMAPLADYRRHQGESGRLDVTATLTVARYRVAAALPLRPGARYEDGTVRAVISSVQNQDGNCLVWFRETQVSLLLAPSASVHRRMLFFRFNPDVLYVLRNRRRGEAFWPQNGMTFGFGWPTRTRVDEAAVMAMYRSKPESGPPLPPIDDAWLGGADLVRIDAEPVGTVERHLVDADFTIPAENAERPS